MCIIDEQRQQRMNEAADKFFRAVVKSYRAVGERGISAHRFNAELAQQFCNGVIESLRRTAEDTRGASQDLTEQSRRGQEATQALAQESTGRRYRVYELHIRLLPRRHTGGEER